MMPLPPWAKTMRLAVPAYWSLAPNRIPDWDRLTATGSALSITVIDASWAVRAATDIPWRDNEARPRLETLPGLRLGYVSTRRPGTYVLKPVEEVLRGDQAPEPHRHVQAWFNSFAGAIDGIYFDELVLYQDPDLLMGALNLVEAYKQRFGGFAMVLAGQQKEDILAVKRPAPNDQQHLIDCALMWESRWASYRDRYNTQVLRSADEKLKPIPERATLGQAAPSWWKDPQNRPRIAHVVHNVQEEERQWALGLAKERNAGHIFVMHRRGLRNPADPESDDLYHELPPYWNQEVADVNSYFDFGFDPLRVVLAAHRYRLVSQPPADHAWPSFEQAWQGDRHVRGTFLLSSPSAPDNILDVTDLLLAVLPPPYDITRVWGTVHAYAVAQGWTTGLPTFELTQGGTAMRVILLRNLPGRPPWLHRILVELSDTYERPTFGEPGAVIRNVGRAATLAKYGSHGSAFPTFVPDNPNDPEGVAAHFECFAFDVGTHVRWADVETLEYMAQLNA